MPAHSQSQYHRNIRATIGLDDDAVEVTQLRMAFEVRRSVLGSDIPNTCALDIFNLSRHSREQMSNASHKKVKLEVGYGQNSPVLHQIFLGDATAPIIHTHGNATWRSRILAQDAYTARRNAVISQSFTDGTSVKQILSAVVDTFGLPHGLSSPPGDLDGLPRLLKSDALSGQSVKVLDRIAKSHNLDWSFQDGVVEVSGRNSFYETDEIPEIAPGTGMIGSPIVSDEGLSVRSLLNPLIRIKRKIRIQSDAADLQVSNLVVRAKDAFPRFRNGDYLVLEVLHTGDTHGNDWLSTTKTFPADAPDLKGAAA